jgi:hypothetical protein
VSPPPVNAVAGRAFHVLLLRAENVRRHAVLDLFFTLLDEYLVTFQAPREGFNTFRQVQRFHYLDHLLLRHFAENQDYPEAAVLHHSPQHYPPVPGQYHPLFRQRLPHHIGIVTAVEEPAVESHHPQPAGQFAHIMVDDEFDLFDNAVSPAILYPDSHPLAGQGNFRFQLRGYFGQFVFYLVLLDGVHVYREDPGDISPDVLETGQLTPQQ